MDWKKVVDFLKPTVFTISLVVIFFFILPMPVEVFCCDCGSGSYWTIEIFPSIGIISSWTSWDYEEYGVKYYFPPSMLQVLYLILIAIISYLLACTIVFYITRRRNRIKKV